MKFGLDDGVVEINFFNLKKQVSEKRQISYLENH